MESISSGANGKYIVYKEPSKEAWGKKNDLNSSRIKDGGEVGLVSEIHKPCKYMKHGFVH